MAAIIRMSTPIFPVMDNAYIDTYFFFVPNRLIWDHWKEFNGENTESYWTQPTEYEIPQIRIEDYTVQPKTLLDYMGIPIYKKNFSINALPVRAYCLIWNEWFKDQNLQQPVQINTETAQKSIGQKITK